MARKKMTAADMQYAQQKAAHEAALWSAMDAKGWTQDKFDFAVYSSESSAELHRRDLNGE